MDEKLLSWCAGLLEGEGNLAIRRKGRDCFYPFVDIGNTERDLIAPFVDLFGGRIYIEPRGQNQEMFRFRLYGGDAIRFAAEIRPYLRGSRKARLCDLILQYAEIRYRCLGCGGRIEAGSRKWYCSKSCKWKIGHRRARDPNYELPRARLSKIFTQLAYRSYELNGGRESPPKWEPPSKDSPVPSRRGRWIRPSQKGTPIPR